MRRVNKAAQKLVNAFKNDHVSAQKILEKHFMCKNYQLVYAILRQKITDDAYKAILTLTLSDTPIHQGILRTLMAYKNIIRRDINFLNFAHVASVNKNPHYHKIVRTIAKNVDGRCLALLNTKEIQRFIVGGMNPNLCIPFSTNVLCNYHVIVPKSTTLLQLVTIMNEKMVRKVRCANLLIQRGANEFVVDNKGLTSFRALVNEIPYSRPLKLLLNSRLARAWYYDPNPLVTKNTDVEDLIVSIPKTKNYIEIVKRVQKELFDILKQARCSPESPFYVDVFPRDLFKEILSYLKIVF